MPSPEGDGPQMRVAARVLPDVAGVDREFDYSVPADMAGLLRPGSIVRVPLHGRRVRGWVTAYPAEAPPGLELFPVERVVSWGPEPEVLGLVPWAAWRWAGRRRSFLVTASPLRAVRSLPTASSGHFKVAPGLTSPPPGPSAPLRSPAELATSRWRPGAHVLRLPPAVSATDLVLATAARGPVLVLAPTKERAHAGAGALRRRGADVALLPEDWPRARAGADVVIGTRGAAWAPCPGLRSVVVLDAHDEGYVQQQAPTWDAAAIGSERAARAGVPCFWVSPCPTLELLETAQDLTALGPSLERQGWAPVLVADQRDQDPRLGLYSKVLVDLAREEKGRLVCVLNRKGRAVLLTCGACGELATCECCGAAVAMVGDELACRQCGAVRPIVCRRCSSDGLRVARPGVSRAREQLEALTGRPTAEVTGNSGPVPEVPVLVGTEAILYREGELRRGGSVGAVVFLDFDQELHAPRYRAGEEALSLLARASRLLGGRQRGGRVLVQTRAPDHPAIAAAQRADPGRLAASERPVRKALGLPPYGALAVLSGPGASELARALGALALGAEASGPSPEGGASRAISPLVPAPGSRGERPWLEVAEVGEERFVARANGPAELADALAAVGRPADRVRVEVGPVRF